MLRCVCYIMILFVFTDETPVNCVRFLAADGLHLFHQCYQQFQNETELVRNMMGLIGNIAEVEQLRSELMNDDYINIFWYVLNSLFGIVKLIIRSFTTISNGCGVGSRI